MSPLFGNREDKAAEEAAAAAALTAEVDRLDALPLHQLAVEVMTKGFSPGAPGAAETVTVGGPNVDAGTTVGWIATELAPGGSTAGADEQLRLRLYRLVAEALQELEHASLIRAQLHSVMGTLDYATTRRGRAALEAGAVDRVLAGDDL